MAAQPEYSTIDTTIRRALLGQGFEDKRYYVQAFINARRWYENEYAGGIEKAYGHRTATLQVEVDRTAALPADYVEWNMVGVRRGEQLVNLLSNPALVQVPAAPAVSPGLPPGAVVAEPLLAVGPPLFEYFYTNWLHNQGFDTLVGVGYPLWSAGEFTIQRAERQLLVSSRVSPGTILYLHYLSDDAPVGESTLIHPLAEAWLEFYVLGFLHEQKNPGLAQAYQRRAEQQRSEYMQKRADFGLDDLYEAMRTSLHRRG